MTDELLEDKGNAAPDAEMPSGMERRLVLRLLSYWRELLPALAEDEYDEDDEDLDYDEEDEVMATDFMRRYPSFADIDRREISDFWPSCFLLDFNGPGGGAVFTEVGSEYGGYYPGSLLDVPVSSLQANTLAEQSTAYLQEIIAKGVPITRGGEFTNSDGETVLFRSIILPLSDDGENIDGFIGAANCRIVSKK